MVISVTTGDFLFQIFRNFLYCLQLLNVIVKQTFYTAYLSLRPSIHQSTPTSQLDILRRLDGSAIKQPKVACHTLLNLKTFARGIAFS